MSFWLSDLNNIYFGHTKLTSFMRLQAKKLGLITIDFSQFHMTVHKTEFTDN